MKNLPEVQFRATQTPLTTFEVQFAECDESWDCDDLQHFILILFDYYKETGFEPLSFFIGNVRLYWNFYLAHQFAAEGRITEQEFIQACIMAKGGKA